MRGEKSKCIEGDKNQLEGEQSKIIEGVVCKHSKGEKSKTEVDRNFKGKSIITRSRKEELELVKEEA